MRTKVFILYSALFVIICLLSACSDSASQASNPAVENIISPPLPPPPLLAPQDFNISTSGGAVTLSWSKSATEGRAEPPSYNVYWNSTSSVSRSDTKIENITSPYVVGGLTEGETYYFIITSATSDEESMPSFEVPVTAPFPVLVSLSIQPQDAFDIIGSTVQFSAEGIYSDGKKIDVTSVVNWLSKDEGFAVIDDDINKGLLTAIKNGTTTISVTDPISKVTGATAFRTQISHSFFGDPLPACQSSGCHKRPSIDIHPNSTNMCNACHSIIEPFTWLPFVVVEHNEVVGTCVGCHDGVKYRGKSVNHINSTNRCDLCHTPDTDLNTPEWLVPIVDHSQILGSCVDCHNAILAIGKDADHINSSNECVSCHNTIVFRPVLNVDHNEVIGACEDCHDGVIAKGRGLGHVGSSDICGDCHVVQGWLL